MYVFLALLKPRGLSYSLSFFPVLRQCQYGIYTGNGLYIDHNYEFFYSLYEWVRIMKTIRSNREPVLM